MEWFKDDTERLSRASEEMAEQIPTDSERVRYQLESGAALSELKSANQRFVGAFAFSIVATLLMSISGFREGFACGALLLFAPGLACSFGSEQKSYRLSPLPEMDKKARFRNTFASSVWAIATGAVLAGVFLRWGEMGGSPESPW